MGKRTVKLGRKLMVTAPVPPLALHWAVKAGDTWYEITIQKKTSGKRTLITKSKGFAAESSAGTFGGELAGQTDKTDSEIDAWTEKWCEDNHMYDLLEKNCQVFAYEFIYWLTDGNFICAHRFNAATIASRGRIAPSGFAMAEDGNAVAKYGSTECRGNYGTLNASARASHFQAQAVAGPGLGAFAEASAGKAEASYGNVVGIHVEPNLNTGVGVRNGNAEAHLLGFGAKIGSDGIEVNTPLGGVNACKIM